MLESSYIFRGPPCPSWLGVTRLVGTAKDICVEFPRLGFDHQPDQHLINARIKLYFRGPPCPSWLGVARLVGTAKDICVEFPRLGFDHQPDQHLINARIKLYF